MKWRKFNIIIHRDLGYLCFGLTILYVISGVAVNHIHDWNPTYEIEKTLNPVDLSGELCQGKAALTDGLGFPLFALRALAALASPSIEAVSPLAFRTFN